MATFNIQNKAEDSVTIDILGAIGESFFDEGVTMQSVAEQLSDVKEINLNVSSLGGSLVHALAIHDILKMHPAKVVTNIIGMTASAGTIIAMAGDTINMSDNSMFLVHPVRTSADGTAKDLREVADDLDKADERLINLYQKRINSVGKNKKKSEIMSLMEQEKWISAEEAIAWGFVDNKVLAKNTIKNEVITSINNSNYLPKLETMNTFEKVLNFFGIAQDAEAIEDKVMGEITNLKADIDNKAVEIDTLKQSNEALTNEVAEVKASIESKEVEFNNAIEAKDAELISAKAEREEMERKYNELLAAKTEPIIVGDPDTSKQTKQLTPSEIAAAQAQSGLAGRW